MLHVNMVSAVLLCLATLVYRTWQMVPAEEDDGSGTPAITTDTRAGNGGGACSSTPTNDKTCRTASVVS